jgi:hypothetical protein
MGFKPMTSGTGILHSIQLSYGAEMYELLRMVVGDPDRNSLQK